MEECFTGTGIPALAPQGSIDDCYCRPCAHPKDVHFRSSGHGVFLTAESRHGASWTDHWLGPAWGQFWILFDAQWCQKTRNSLGRPRRSDGHIRTRCKGLNQ
eukprot:gene18174-biopygen21929